MPQFGLLTIQQTEWYWTWCQPMVCYSKNFHDPHWPSSRLVPPPSQPFHVVMAPGWAREGARPPGPPEVHYPLQLFCQTPGPITTSQTYLQTLIIEQWDAKLRCCEEACKVQLSEHIWGPVTHQSYVQELILGCWSTEKQQCQEACKVQLLELLLAVHGITSLV